MPLAKAYVMYSFYDLARAQKLIEIVKVGIQENDHEKIRPFLILLQHMMEAAEQGNQMFAKLLYM